MNKQSILFSNFLHTPAKAQLAFFKVPYRIAKCEKPHTIAEELVLPAAFDLASTMIGESFVQKLKALPLSNNTICTFGFITAPRILISFQRALSAKKVWEPLHYHVTRCSL